MLIVFIYTHIIPFRVCTFARLTGYPCAFCGYSRSAMAFMEGEWRYAIWNCPLSIVVFAAIVVLMAWNLTGLLMGRIIERGRWLRPGKKMTRILWIIGVMLILANWCYRLAMGLS